MRLGAPTLLHAAAAALSAHHVKAAVTPPIVCPTDVKLCPGGTGGYVTRDPFSNCRFRPCPEEAQCATDEGGGSLTVKFDGTNATCGGANGYTCRRFHGESSGTCSGYRLFFTLGLNRTVEVTSCSADGVLDFKLEGEAGDFSTAERRYFAKLADGIENGTSAELDDRTTLDFQSIRAARILFEWPIGLDVSYSLNAAQEQGRQRPYQLVTGPGMAGLHLIPPRPPSGLYTSLCAHAGPNSLYLHDANSNMAARLGMDPPCSGTEGMDIYTSSWSCLAPPFPTPSDGVSHSRGNCFGRCGSGCDRSTSTQFTVDCADLDFCSRFGIGKGTDGGCDQAFLNALDDWMWSGNCDLDEKVELDPSDRCREA